MQNNNNIIGQGRKFNIPPIAFIIAAAVIILGCVIGICSVYSSYYEDESFKNEAGTVDAVCTEKTVFDEGTGDKTEVHYVMIIEFKTDENKDEEPYQVVLDETDEYFGNISIGDTIPIYYDKENPTICHPTILYSDPTAIYVVLGIVIFAAVILAGINLNTLLRNIHGYTPVYTKPEEIGVMGDGSAENGLGDSSVDYNAADVFSDKLMESYVDPFAAYSGYEGGENGNPEIPQGEYYDPNSKYSGNQSFDDNSHVPHDVDINNPFVTNVNSDPDNPYNMGNYQPDERNEESYNNPFAIYGDGSFGAAPPTED